MFTPANSLRLLLSVSTAISFSLPAYAQDAGTVTPPARVGQIAHISGSVSYYGAGSNGQWVAATMNYPLVAGDSLFTQDNSRAAVALDSSRLTLDKNTEMQITALDGSNFTATESQGEVFLNLAYLQPGQSFTINTPRGAVNFDQNGQYDIIAGDVNDPTTVSVLAGSATVGQMQIPAGQAGYLSGTDQTIAQLGAIQRDDFIDQMLAELAPPPPPYAPPVVRQMTGIAVLSNYGVWNQVPQYGAVWYPRVNIGWAPYRVGHWAFIPPWGWTWVDAEPWGFAPFHYGRWIRYGGRWGWVPAAAYESSYGLSYQPVYAPALVTFFGIGVGVVITSSVLASGSVGWVPLAPYEPYYPTYYTNPAYMRRINRADVRNYNYTQLNIKNITINNYANRGAATYISSSVMARGEAVSNYGRPMTKQMFGQARPVEGNFNQLLRPNISHREAPAPHVSDFARRRNIPQPLISPTPMQPGGRPQGFQKPQGKQTPQKQQFPQPRPPAPQVQQPRPPAPQGFQKPQGRQTPQKQQFPQPRPPAPLVQQPRPPVTQGRQPQGKQPPTLDDTKNYKRPQ